MNSVCPGLERVCTWTQKGDDHAVPHQLPSQRVGITRLYADYPASIRDHSGAAKAERVVELQSGEPSTDARQ